VSNGFWSSAGDFIKTYPWQTATVIVAIIAIMVNVRGTGQLIKALEIKKKGK
jgi:hypothetical protein